MTISLPRPRWLWTLALALCAAAPQAVAAEKSGEQIYRKQCASCHGASGEGTEDYPRALEGDRSVPQLAKVIAKTMPEDAPGTCVGPDAEKVAAYLYDAFYSSAAREKNKPPRVELARLTVRQYRNAVTDLLGSFRGPSAWEGERGLRAEYFKSRRFRKDDRELERVDPTVRFDFKQGGPEGGKFDPHEFSIKWEGSVFAPETGEYEFLVRTQNAARLYVNDPKSPLIDAWVKSGDDTEYRGTIHLLGGRAYPVRLDFSKAKQGVNDSDKNKDRPIPPASVALEWTPPNRAHEVIPAHCLASKGNPVSFVPVTPFPADDRSTGYERGTSVSKAWDEATTAGAIEVANYVATHLRDLAGVGDGGDDRVPKLREFARKFAERAFRRPLTDEQAKAVVGRAFDGARDPETAIKRAVLLTLKSPRFLYREAGGLDDSYDVAARVSFALWDSLPDPALLEAAAKGELKTREQVAAQAERMVNDLRARAKVREFFFQWLRVEAAPDLSKDPALYPGFDKALASDLRTSLTLTLDDLLWEGPADFRQLLLSENVYLNGRLAQFYGADLPADAPFKKVALEPQERAGLVSHPYLLANFAYTGTSSPIHRGVFLARSVLGRGLKPPPEAVSPLAPDLHAGLSTRERVTLQTSPAACMTCHGMVNPLGFGLEQFDAVGRYRKDEKGKPIDASGVYEAPDGGTAPFQGARGLATILAESPEAHAAFVDQFFHYLVKQPIRAYGPNTRPELNRAFAADNFSVRKLAVAIVAASALPPKPEAAKP